MEKGLSKQQLLAIEKIRNSQKITKKPINKKKNTQRARKNTTKHIDQHFPLTARQTPYFPATTTEFQGVHRPAEAREKSRTLQKFLIDFKIKTTKTKKNNPNKIQFLKPFNFFKR